MSIPVKTKAEVDRMREGGSLLAGIMAKVVKQVQPGRKLKQLDQLTEKLIEKSGGQPSFKMVSGYNWATCININQGVVHGIPDDYQIQPGDLVSLDMGMFYRGWHTDMARTVYVNSKKSDSKSETEKFVGLGRRTLKRALRVAKVGNRIGHISQVIGREIKQAGFSPIESLTGHGIGLRLHEPPQIPCFLQGSLKTTALIKPGMTLAIEVIYAQGKPDVLMDENGWTIRTSDGSLAALFEDTVAVTTEKPLIITA